jgi:histidine triad (HIT) family protein
MMDLGEQHRGVFGRIMVLAGKLAREEGANDGFRLIVNTGRVGRQEVDHVHLHIIGGGDPLGSMLPRPRG